MPLNLLPVAVPESLPLRHPDNLQLRRVRAADAEAIARATSESLEHLRPWMPWAADPSCVDPEFQRLRLVDSEAAWARAESFDFVIVRPGSADIFGCCGLMTRRGPRTLEIGYWSHASVAGRGYARAAAAGLTDIALGYAGIDEIFVVCDAANLRSAAIPRALGYRLRESRPRPVSAPAEIGEELIWVRPGPG